MEVKEPAIAYSKHYITIPEYIDIEEAAIGKNEYYKGLIRPMPDVRLPHIITSGNFLFELRERLGNKGWTVFGKGMRLHIEKNTLITYPDAAVMPKNIQTLNNDDIHVSTPSLLVEVLCDPNKGYDREEKFRLYRDIPTLKEYTIADPDTKSIKNWYINANGNWELNEYSDINTSLHLHSLNIDIPLPDIFEGV